MVCRELQRATRAILHEFQLPATMCRSTVCMVQGALNNSKLKRLQNKCPIEIFTGHRQDSAVTAIATTIQGATVVHSLSDTRLDAILKTMTMHDKLHDMHREIEKSSSRRRKNAVEAHNRRTNVRPVNFTIGDFVLRGETRSGPKLRLKWTGPYRVTECKSEFLFQIEELGTGIKSTSQGPRLKLFRNSDYEITEDVLNHLDYQKGELLVIESFENIRERQGHIELEVKWRGFESAENDWLSLEVLREDVPEMLSEHLEEISASGTPRQRAIAQRLI